MTVHQRKLFNFLTKIWQTLRCSGEPLWVDPAYSGGRPHVKKLGKAGTLQGVLNCGFSGEN